MRILFINDNLPYPPIAGDKIRVYNLIRRVARHHEVSLAALVGTYEDVEAVEHLREFCFRVETGIKRPRHRLKHLPGLLRYLVAGIPLEFSVQYSKKLATKIRELTSQVDFDIVQFEHSHMALTCPVFSQVSDTNGFFPYIMSFFSSSDRSLESVLRLRPDCVPGYIVGK